MLTARPYLDWSWSLVHYAATVRAVVRRNARAKAERIRLTGYRSYRAASFTLKVLPLALVAGVRL